MSYAVNHSKHHNPHPSGVKCIQVVELLNFNVGNPDDLAASALATGVSDPDRGKTQLVAHHSGNSPGRNAHSDRAAPFVCERGRKRIISIGPGLLGQALPARARQ